MSTGKGMGTCVSERMCVCVQGEWKEKRRTEVRHLNRRKFRFPLKTQTVNHSKICKLKKKLTCKLQQLNDITDITEKE